MLLELGVDAAIVQEVLGHADPRSTRGYQKVRTGATKTAASGWARACFRALLSLILSLSGVGAAPDDRGKRRLTWESRLRESNSGPTHYEAVD
jgi:hypothetical protein